MPDVASIYRTVRVMGIPRGEVSPGASLPDGIDPVDAAMLRRRALLATRVEEDTASQIAAQGSLDSRRLELEEAKLEVEREALAAKLAVLKAEREKLNSNGNGHGDANVQAMIALLGQQAQGAANDAKEAQASLFALLNESIEQSRARDQDRREPPASSTVAERVAELVQLRQAMAELFPPAPVQQGVNPHQLLELRKMELDVEFQRARLAEESQDRVRRAALEERRIMEEASGRAKAHEVEQERNARLAALVEQLGPPAVAALTQMIGGRNGDGPVGGPQPMGPQMPPELPNVRRCVVCEGPFQVPPGGGPVACPHCHAYQEVVLERPA